MPIALDDYIYTTGYTVLGIMLRRLNTNTTGVDTIDTPTKVLFAMPEDEAEGLLANIQKIVDKHNLGIRDIIDTTNALLLQEMVNCQQEINEFKTKNNFV